MKAVAFKDISIKCIHKGKEIMQVMFILFQVSGFKGHAPLTAQRRIIETGNHKARLRITSAALKRNVHRQQ